MSAKSQCWNCGNDYLKDPNVDCMDATCYLCNAPYDKSRCKEFGFVPKSCSPAEDKESKFKKCPRCLKMVIGAHTCRPAEKSQSVEEKAMTAVDELERLKQEVKDIVSETLKSAHARGFQEGLESAAKVAETIYPKAHTYSSENADIYRAQDGTMKSIAKAIRNLKP